MIRKYHNHKLQTTPWHCEEEPLNHHETPGRQIKQSNQLSLPHQDDCNTKFGLFVDEDHSKLPTLYWLPKLHKRPYKLRFIANSSACTTAELSILLTSCLTAIKNHVIKYCTTVYERNGKKIFWSIKSSDEILNKLNSRGFLASGLSTYDFSTLYATLPHNLIK